MPIDLDQQKAKRFPRLRLAAMVVRAAFLSILVALIARVSLPQSESIWTAYENFLPTLCGWPWGSSCRFGSCFMRS